MKKIFVFCLSVLIIVSSIVSFNASIVSDIYPDFEFESEYDNTYSVSKYNGIAGEVVIPESLYDREINRVYEKAFYNNSVITSLYMHDKMTVINERAFRSCANLSYVYFSENLAAIWDYSFAQDPKLNSALLKNTKINTLYKNCFFKDTSLKYISLPNTLTSIGVSAFDYTQIENIVIPSSVTEIKATAFGNNNELKRIYIPASVVSLASNIFKNSPNVTVYTVSNSAAEQYCADNSIPCEIIDESDFPADLNGDVDNNKKVNIRDATMMQYELAYLGKGFISHNCDVNGDCAFNIRDVTKLQRNLAFMDDDE